MKEQDKKFIHELILTLISTGGILVIYWFQGMDEHDREILIEAVRRKLRPTVTKADKFRLEILKFRQEISRWEHEQRRGNASQG